MNGVRTVPISQLRVSKVNPRRSPGDVSELAASVRLLGVIEPLIVAPDGDGFVVLAGSRRLAAAQLAELDRVPIIVREDLSEEQREVLMLSENLHRRKLSHLEIATVYARLMKLFGLNQREVAEHVGMSQTHINHHLAFLRLKKSLIQKVENGEVSFDEALGLGVYRDYTQKPKQPQGRPSGHLLDGHRTCNPERCEVRALTEQLR